MFMDSLKIEENWRFHKQGLINKILCISRKVDPRKSSLRFDDICISKIALDMHT